MFPLVEAPADVEGCAVHCESPMVFTIDGFLSATECEHFKSLACGRMRRAQVVGGSADTVDAPHMYSEGRTNSNTWLQMHDPVLVSIEHRICSMLGVPPYHSEHFQVVQYEKGQRYGPHMDTHAVTTADTPGGQRTATVLLYLNDVEGGGTTDFVKLGLSVEPRQGRLLCFHNCLPGTNTPDPRTLHTGTAVTSGEKWAVNKWIRERRIRLSYEREGEPGIVHLGMTAVELLALIADLSLEEAETIIEEEQVALPASSSAKGLGLTECQCLLRAHWGIDSSS